MADAGHVKTEKMLGQIESKLDKLYSQAASETKEKYLKYVEKFQKKEAEKRALLDSGKITQEQFNKWRESAIFSGKQYQNLANTMARDLTMTNQKAMSIVNGYIPEAYALNRNYAMYQLGVGGVNISSIFTLYDRHTVEYLVKRKGALLPKPKVDIPKDLRWNRAHIKNAIAQGVLQGESIPKIAKRLQKVVGMNKVSAIRNARTAMTGAQNAGRIDSYNYAKKELDVNVMKEWLASGDGLTRESHAEISGERIKMNEVFSNGCEYPGDPGGAPEEVYNCRCTLLPYLPDYDFEQKDLGGEKKFDDWVEDHENDEKKRLDDAVANAKEYSKYEHEADNYDSDFWNSKLTDEERAGVREYTGSAYTRMNDYLRGKKDYIDDAYKEYIKGCESALSKCSVKNDTKLYRGMGSDRTLARALGISTDEVKEIVADRSIVGMRFTEKGFCSTGINSEAGWDKEVSLEIVAPKGTKGMYVDPISKNRGEKELLLQKGTIFEIYDVESRVDRWGDMHCILKVVVAGLE